MHEKLLSSRKNRQNKCPKNTLRTTLNEVAPTWIKTAKQFQNLASDARSLGIMKIL